MKVRPCEFLVYGVYEGVRVCGLFSRGGRLRGRAVFRRVREGERAPVDQAVQSDQRQRHCDGLSHPSPFTAQNGHVRNDAQQRPR